MHYNYCGIIRKEYPKWEGWKIISEYKEKGIDVQDITDTRLEILVENFYMLKYIEVLITNQTI